jgi:TrbL/VirB6 plasmid conjugal transfer protein
MVIAPKHLLNYARKLSIIIMAVIAADGLLSVAFSQGLFSLFLQSAGPTCPPPALTRIFSGFLCQYEQMLDSIMAVVYSGMLGIMNAPLFALLTLFVSCTAILFMTGIVPFSIRDFMLIMFKVVLVMGFATNSAYMIDLLYVGVVGFAQGTTDAILGVVAPAQGNIQGIFAWIDNVFGAFLVGQGNNATASTQSAICDNNLLALLFGLAVAMPVFFGMGVYILLQMAFSFFKAIMNYVIAMTGIMFLSAMSPLFFMFALFKFTSDYFENWLKYLVGFAVQIFIIFAFVGVVINLLSSPSFVARKDKLLAMIQPYDKTIQHDGHRVDFNGWCSICIRDASTGVCSGDVFSPSVLQAGGAGGGGSEDLINLMLADIFYLGLLGYILNILISAAPDISRSLISQLGAPRYSGELPMGGTVNSATDKERLADSMRTKPTQTNSNRAGVGSVFGGLTNNRK